MSARFGDRLAGLVIRTGGVLIIAAVLAILVFIVREAAPLASGAAVRPSASVSTAAVPLCAGSDEYGETGFTVLPRGVAVFQLATGTTITTFPSVFADSTHDASRDDIVVARYDPRRGLLGLGASDGRVALAHIDFETQWTNGVRSIVPELQLLASVAVDTLPILRLAADRDSDGAVAMVAKLAGGSLRYLFIDEEGEVSTDRILDIELADRQVTSLVLSLEAGLLAVGSDDGTLVFLDLSDPEEPVLEDRVNAATTAITAIETLLGDESLLVGSANGRVSVWFRVRYMRVTNGGTRALEVDDLRLEPGAEAVLLDRDLGTRYAHRPELRFQTAGAPWTRIREFAVHKAAIAAIAVSPRNKSFATLDEAGVLALQHSTSGRTLARLDAIRQVTGLSFSPRADALLAAARDGKVHRWQVEAPHGEAGVKALFGRIWYEGYAEPQHVWQSTGGSAAFEPKLGLMPLFFGTLKGTLYAMLFSVPVSILGALYLSQLASPGLRALVKPLIELMAAIPTVVVGFLAALWLAPYLERHLGGALGVALSLPFGLVAALASWMLLPQAHRQKAPSSTELLFMLPFLAGAVWLGAIAGGWLQEAWFGGDIRQWLYDTGGIRYDQRNCIVVGIALGFAVVPIIFSICEDAMSSVPPSLTSAALALGASRWQTGVHVILPAASPGIFAAVMLGLGRAIGETMIVLMATGNTPILDLSPFNGMRTMSATIAVEIPEAPHGGTLYRVLFLTGTLLFLCTFLINTLADLVGRRLRKRYAQF